MDRIAPHYICAPTGPWPVNRSAPKLATIALIAVDVLAVVILFARCAG